MIRVTKAEICRSSLIYVLIPTLGLQQFPSLCLSARVDLSHLLRFDEPRDSFFLACLRSFDILEATKLRKVHLRTSNDTKTSLGGVYMEVQTPDSEIRCRGRDLSYGCYRLT